MKKNDFSRNVMYKVNLSKGERFKNLAKEYLSNNSKPYLTAGQKNRVNLILFVNMGHKNDTMTLYLRNQILGHVYQRN